MLISNILVTNFYAESKIGQGSHFVCPTMVSTWNCCQNSSQENKNLLQLLKQGKTWQVFTAQRPCINIIYKQELLWRNENYLVGTSFLRSFSCSWWQVRGSVIMEDAGLSQKALFFLPCQRHNFKPDFSLFPKEINSLWPFLFKSHSCKQAAASLQGVRASLNQVAGSAAHTINHNCRKSLVLASNSSHKHHFRFAVIDMKKFSPCICTVASNHRALTCPSFFGIAWICCLDLVGDWNVIDYDLNIFMKHLCLLWQNCITKAEYKSTTPEEAWGTTDAAKIK